jgi:hypothetical protein
MWWKTKGPGGHLREQNLRFNNNYIIYQLQISKNIYVINHGSAESLTTGWMIPKGTNISPVEVSGTNSSPAEISGISINPGMYSGRKSYCQLQGGMDLLSILHPCRLEMIREHVILSLIFSRL